MNEPEKFEGSPEIIINTKGIFQNKVKKELGKYRL